MPSLRHGFFRNRAAEKAIRKELKLLLVLDNPFIIKRLGVLGFGDAPFALGSCGTPHTTNGTCLHVLCPEKYHCALGKPTAGLGLYSAWGGVPPLP